MDVWGEDVRDKLVKQWHTQIPWPDVKTGLKRLRQKFEIIVLANGSTRLQLDIIKAANLSFDMLFSSQLLGLTKPDPVIYTRAAELVGADLGKGEGVMVAAHAYDLRAAKGMGMGSVYTRRETEDVEEDFGDIEGSVDLFVDGRGESRECGLATLADILGC